MVSEFPKGSARNPACPAMLPKEAIGLCTPTTFVEKAHPDCGVSSAGISVVQLAPIRGAASPAGLGR